MKIWDWWVNLIDKVPGPVYPKITAGVLRWNLEERVLNTDSVKHGAGLKFSNCQCADLLALMNTGTQRRAESERLLRAWVDWLDSKERTCPKSETKKFLERTIP